uniref:ribosome biogenesis protein NOP53 n=1 Tax=Doryrhamphus excisus TaxID=161450 RepID=UPI0025ADBB70|nr:ribosome biogenesis protein NOP53 [Doryrhamphus excisus]
MAAARRLKRVVASQPGYLSLNDSAAAISSRRKRVNKNKKKNWNKHSDINDVEDFLEDIRHQERTIGGLLSEKSDDGLFFLDIGQKQKDDHKVPNKVEGKRRKGRSQHPLRIDMILQHGSHIPPIKDVLSHQQPNAKKLRRHAEMAAQRAAKGIVPKSQRKQLNRKPSKTRARKAETEANNNPTREYYDIWSQEPKDSSDPWYLQQTGKKRVKRPEKLNEKPSVLPAVEVIAPGGSYNPDFFAHQALLQEAHDVEVKKQKTEDKIVRQLAVNKEDLVTEAHIFQEQVEGLVEENEEESSANEGEEDGAEGAITQAEKKTEKQRKKEKAEKIKEQQRQSVRKMTDKRQQLFQLRSIRATIKQQEQRTFARQKLRKAKMEAQKSQPRRLGKLKFHAQDLEVKLSNELTSSLRQLKPEGSVLKDRFKSLQKRNLIEPRERAKFKRRYKLKYVEKRAFREIT